MRHWREQVRGAFWPLPLFLLLVGVALPSLTDWLDYELALPPSLVDGTPLSDESNRAVTSAVTAAMLSFVGVVFSMSLVGLQLAASQMSPRVLRIFARLTITKVTLGVFLATFVYSLTVLGTIGEYKDAEGNSFVPLTSLLMTWVLLFGSLVLFVFYVNTVLRLMRATYVIEAVASEARAVLNEWYPVAAGEPLPERGQPDFVLAATEASVLTAVQHRRLVRVAARSGTVLHLVPRIGDFVARGAPLFLVYGPARPWAAYEALHWGRERTVADDPSYSLRLLVDIAIRALSPAVNDPTTAVQAIDRLVDLMVDIGARPAAAGVHHDRKGVARVVIEVPGFADLLRLAFTEIRLYGAGSPQISRRLLAGLDDLAAVLPEELLPEVRAQREMLTGAVRRLVPDSREQAIALTPDRQGLG
ncbi:DUF2254 domain-containing protein [Longispora albida]|uniref:DUF2254 domain-containing protein n=1 Tax=Longispora albida TaxID=203523 RepID=UPI00036D039C|nr:DUF2254 domain-containing protein [Longispora albida]